MDCTHFALKDLVHLLKVSTEISEFKQSIYLPQCCLIIGLGGRTRSEYLKKLEKIISLFISGFYYTRHLCLTLATCTFQSHEGLDAEMRHNQIDFISSLSVLK